MEAVRGRIWMRKQRSNVTKFSKWKRNQRLGMLRMGGPKLGLYYKGKYKRYGAFGYVKNKSYSYYSKEYRVYAR